MIAVSEIYHESRQFTIILQQGFVAEALNNWRDFSRIRKGDLIEVIADWKIKCDFSQMTIPRTQQAWIAIAKKHKTIQETLRVLCFIWLANLIVKYYQRGLWNTNRCFAIKVPPPNSPRTCNEISLLQPIIATAIKDGRNPFST